MSDLKTKALAMLGSRKFYLSLSLGVMEYLRSGDWRLAVMVTLGTLFGGLAIEDVGKARQ